MKITKPIVIGIGVAVALGATAYGLRSRVRAMAAQSTTLPRVQRQFQVSSEKARELLAERGRRLQVKLNKDNTQNG